MTNGVGMGGGWKTTVEEDKDEKERRWLTLPLSTTILVYMSHHTCTYINNSQVIKQHIYPGVQIVLIVC